MTSIGISKTNKFYNLVDVSQTKYKDQGKIIDNEVQVIRIGDVTKCLEDGGEGKTPKLIGGTVCEKIYHNHCLFCSIKY